jgi:hypothetical protein
MNDTILTHIRTEPDYIILNNSSSTKFGNKFNFNHTTKNRKEIFSRGS